MSRSARMSADDSAIISWIICFSMSSSPLVPRLIARSHIMSNAASHWPTHRIAWWMRPAVEPLLREHEAVALRADPVGDRDPAVVQEDLGVPARAEVPGVGVAHVEHVARDVEARACPSG